MATDFDLKKHFEQDWTKQQELLDACNLLLEAHALLEELIGDENHMSIFDALDGYYRPGWMDLKEKIVSYLNKVHANE